MEGLFRRKEKIEPLIVPTCGYLGDLETRKLALWKKVGGWIDLCESKHAHCSSQATAAVEEEPFCPNRLLDIRSAAPRLVRKDEIDVRTVRYAPLSYCWGKTMPEPAKTKMSTLDRKRIDEEKLPRTFKDAIEVGRNLNIPFLWIDALCIIQDSEEDWEREAALMGEIYRHGVLTIAAAIADNCDGGFLQDPKPIVGEMGMSRWAASFSSENPLQRRGWILQERELSPRILYFTPSQALWECRELRACEWDPKDGSRKSWGEGMYSRCFDWDFQKDRDIAVRSHGWHVAWNATVDDFCSRSFTKVEDRLPALAGLAKQFQLRIQDYYLAGIWEQSLPEALLWSRKGDTPLTRVDVPGFYHPTWSWISVLGDINHPYTGSGLGPNLENKNLHDPNPDPDPLNLTAKILEVNLVQKGSDPYGALQFGLLRIRGLLKHLSSRDRLTGGELLSRREILTRRHILSRNQPMKLYSGEQLSRGEILLRLVLGKDPPFGNFSYDFGEPRASDENIFILSLQNVRRYEGGEFVCQGLLLAATVGGALYQRIGIVTDFSPWWLEGGEEKEVVII